MIEVNKRYGCLTVLDMGEEYKTLDQYIEYVDEYKKLQEECKPYIDKLEEYDKIFKDDPELKEIIDNHNPITPEQVNFYEEYRMFQITLHNDLKLRHLLEIKPKLEPHFKCICTCGKTHYYNETTILKKPKYCKYPVKIADMTGKYNIKQIRANEKRRRDYSQFENVVLVNKPRTDKAAKIFRLYSGIEEQDYSLPSDEYCEKYNRDKRKKMEES